MIQAPVPASGCQTVTVHAGPATLRGQMLLPDYARALVIFVGDGDGASLQLQELTMTEAAVVPRDQRSVDISLEVVPGPVESDRHPECTGEDVGCAEQNATLQCDAYGGQSDALSFCRCARPVTLFARIVANGGYIRRPDQVQPHSRATPWNSAKTATLR
jgi:hypothetical protein